MRSPALLVLPLALLAAACGSSSSSSSSSSSTAASTPATSTPASTSSSPMLSVRSLPGLGTVLVNAQGRTLYTFAPDHGKKVTCVGQCAAVWPPLAASSAQKPPVASGVRASLVGSDPNPSGGRVVTYAGWPLYLYTADPKAGTDNGQGINSAGGLWHVIAPTGSVVTAKPSSGSSSGSGSSNGSGGSPY